jgi:hypothetical protein
VLKTLPSNKYQALKKTLKTVFNLRGEKFTIVDQR